MRFHVSQKRIALILLPIFDKLQFVVSICQNVKKLHRVPYLAFGTNFYPKIKTAKTPTTTERQLRHAHTEIHKLQYHRRFLVLFSMLYPLFNKTKRIFNETVCERTRFAKILTTYLLFTVGGILLSEQL